MKVSALQLKLQLRKYERLLKSRLMQIGLRFRRKRESEFAIEVKEISKKFGKKTVVNSVSFTINPGEVFCLLGPNGAGKSVLTKIIAGLISPNEGEVRIQGIPAKRAKRRFGYCPPESALYTNLTVYENLMYFGRLYSLSANYTKRKIDELLMALGLEEVKEKQFGYLSSGQQKRAAIVCSLLHDPEVIILDEPTSGIDPLSRRKLWDFLLKTKKTILFSTHDMDEADHFSNQVAIMSKGNVVQIGTPEYLKGLVSNKKVVRFTSYPGDADKIISTLEALKFVGDVFSFHGKSIVTLNEVDDSRLSMMSRSLQRINEQIVESHFSDAGLEDVFMALAGESLRQ